MSFVDVDMHDLDKLRRDLQTFSKKSIPFATRIALNNTAETGRLIWETEMRDKFQLRNKFTQGSVQIMRVRRGMNVNAMFSMLGSISPYMGLQEFGGTSRGKGGTKPIPTAVAAGQAMGAQPRTKIVRPARRMPRINLSKRITKGSKAQRNAANVRQAAQRKTRYALIEMKSGKRGIVRVTGTKPKTLTVRLIWDLSRRSVGVIRRPTLEPTIKRLRPLIPAIHKTAIINELRHRKILGF